MARFTVGLLFAVRLLSPAAISAQPLPNGPTLLSGETESATRSWARPAMPEPDDGATDAWQDAPTVACAGENADETVATDDAVEAFASAVTDSPADEEETTSSNAPRDAGEVTAIELRQVRPAIGDAAQENVQTHLDVPDYAPQDVPTLIADAAQRWGLDSRQMLRVAWCESRWNPGAQSRAGAAGVFQFIPSTWRLASAAVNMSYASPYDPVANIEAASWLMATQGPRHWTCR